MTYQGVSVLSPVSPTRETEQKRVHTGQNDLGCVKAESMAVQLVLTNATFLAV